MSDIPKLELQGDGDIVVDNTTVPTLSTQTVIDTAEKEINEIDKLSEEERTAIMDFAEKIDVENTQQILQYGSAATTKISKFSDTILQETRNKDVSVVGDDLIKLTKEIKSLDVNEKEKKGFFKFLKPAKDKIDEITINFNSVSDNIDGIVVSLENHQRTLLKDVHMLDTMYEENKSYFKELNMYILAGEERLRKYEEEEIPAQKKIAQESSDQIETQKLNDMINSASRFEKKLHDLKLSKTLSIQMAPQIRLLQNNNSVLVEKIQSSIVNAIPLWKNHIVIALGLENSKKALEAQTKVTDLTNELLSKNSELLKQGSIGIAKESERSIVSIETIQKTNDDLIETINEILTIQENGKKARVEASNELVRIEGELKDALLRANANSIEKNS